MKSYYPIVALFPQPLGVPGQFEGYFKLPLNIQEHWVKYCNLVTLTTMLD